MILSFQDGRSLAVPLAWFPRLQKATPEQRQNWELIGRGIGIHWPEIDEDISIAGLFDPKAVAFLQKRAKTRRRPPAIAKR